MPEQNEATATAEEKQDLHVSAPRAPDVNWANMQPVQIQASKERLDQPHQLVTIRNTSRVQKHIVLDRFMVGHELEAGQEKKDIDMLTSEIAHFVRERDPRRRDAFGRKKPIHPVEIVGIRLDQVETPTEPPKPRAKDAGARAA